mmetsp:Transcript_74755/g.216034  ORF Transcript_74755/g.216034 Transcript_74755/m.216034 type:complete len:343 (-) Transcript_74755:209-1237(-)
MPAWGVVGDKEVLLTTIKSDALEVDVSSYGAALVAVRFRVQGDWVDVLMGYESLERYTGGGKPNFSSCVGRCANRIAGGSFELDGQVYDLEKNNGPNHLHGGTEGYWARAFDVAAVSDTAITLALSDPDGSMGYPGNVSVRVTYEIRGNELHFFYEGTTDKPTLLSLTNHGYWNLKGHQAGNVLDHSLMVVGSRTTAVDAQLIISGELPSVEGTHLDFRTEPHLLQEAVDRGGPIDVNYCLDRPEGSDTDMLAARLVGPNGVTMDVWTDQPGLQVYTGNIIGQPDHPETWWHGKGASWKRFGAISLEPQLWPDGIHHKHFPSPVLRPGETYRQHTWHVFTTA